MHYTRTSLLEEYLTELRHQPVLPELEGQTSSACSCPQEGRKTTAPGMHCPRMKRMVIRGRDKDDKHQRSAHG